MGGIDFAALGAFGHQIPLYRLGEARVIFRTKTTLLEL